MQKETHPTVRQVDKIAESLHFLELLLYYFGICKHDKPMNKYGYVIRNNHLLRLNATTSNERTNITQ